MEKSQDFKLPALYPFLKLYKAPENKATGEPIWTLHNPVANTYFRIDWPEFECLSRFPLYKTAEDLKKSIERETTLRIDLEDIENLVSFLEKSGLTVLQPQKISNALPPVQRLWQRILHGYLYFTIPLCKPQKFLERSLPYISPLLSKNATRIMSGIFALAFVMTLQRLDEFFHTFTGLLSFEGIVQIALTMGFVKIVHEMGHAFTATKNGIAIPHMGVAFIVLYPVLYTETTGSWQLSSRRARFEIGLAGVRSELFLATIALLLWNIFPSGSTAQSLSFLVVTIAMVSSLLVNLNPLMRFDGYYMLSDAMGIENLQSRSCNFARWKLRCILFGIKDLPPEQCNDQTRKFLILFGASLLVYRFFLFSGIALAVYHIFVKPLGLLLMLVELWLFLVLPILSEFKIWHARRQEFARIPRARLAMFIAFVAVLIFVLPIHRDVTLPAISHAAEYISIYPPVPAVVTAVYAREGDRVKKGDVLLTLQSPALEKEWALAKHNLQKIENLKRNVATNGDVEQKTIAVSDEEIEAGRKKLEALQEKRYRLIVVAPFDGKIRDILEGIHQQRAVRSTDLLLRVVDSAHAGFTAFISEDDVSRIRVNDKAVFIPDSQPFLSIPLTVRKVSMARVDALDIAELSSCYGGAIKSDCQNVDAGSIVPLQSLYRVNLEPIETGLQTQPTILRGQIRINGAWNSPFVSFIKAFVGGLMRESGLS